MSGSVISEGALNVNNGAVFTFSRDVTDDDWIFIAELAGDQAVTIQPTDDVSAISPWDLDIAAGDWGVSLFTLYSLDRNAGGTLPDQDMNGVAFKLSDFTGDTGTPTGVNRIEIDDFGNDDQTFTAVDISVVGLAAVIPEPAAVGPSRSVGW